METRDKDTMGYFRKKLERRTYSQDRYYILIKRQKSGEASLHDLEELDEIVNRVPDIREKVILENFYADDESGKDAPPLNPLNIDPKQRKPNGLAGSIRSFFHRLFMNHHHEHKVVSLY
ncbi:MAG: hypothetical protein JSU01_11300 [Bacteroidetes bacterium]|nr:hypothetical protein [Bacteroidota bacterium]